jgi:hypothetical protein
MHGKTGELNPNFGKTRTEETKQLLRELNTGEKNPNFGNIFVHTDEAKQLISEAMAGVHKGRIWYVNAAGETCRCRESPGSEWQLGRVWNG